MSTIKLTFFKGSLNYFYKKNPSISLNFYGITRESLRKTLRMETNSLESFSEQVLQVTPGVFEVRQAIRIEMGAIEELIEYVEYTDATYKYEKGLRITYANEHHLGYLTKEQLNTVLLRGCLSEEQIKEVDDSSF